MTGQKTGGRGQKSEAAALTLTELLVVIGIIALLAGLAVPAFQRIVQSGKATACVSNLRQVGIALHLYLGENGNVMPELKAGRESVNDDVPVLDTALAKYAPDKRVFACPADSAGFAQKTGTSYYWNVALNGQALANLNFLQLATEHSRIPIASDKQGFHPYLEDKVNVLYADGHATKDLQFFTEK